jgi:hypothetical protein
MKQANAGNLSAIKNTTLKSLLETPKPAFLKSLEIVATQALLAQTTNTSLYPLKFRATIITYLKNHTELLASINQRSSSTDQRANKDSEKSYNQLDSLSRDQLQSVNHSLRMPYQFFQKNIINPNNNRSMFLQEASEFGNR